MSENSSPMMNTSNPKFKKAVELIKQSKLYDKDYYLEKNPDIKERGIDPLTHYLFYGFNENRSPSEEFDNDFYLNFYGDVKRAGINPLVHYVLFGEKENRIYNERQRKKIEKTGKITFREVQDRITRPVNSLKYLSEDKYKKITNRHSEMLGTWEFHEEIIGYIKNITSIQKILEINPYRTPLVVKSDIIDSTDKYLPEYPIKIENFYTHNLNHMPLPIENKKYDLVIINNDYDSLDNNQKYQQFFDEITRISSGLLMVLPYMSESQNMSLNNIDEQKINLWMKNRKIEKQTVVNGRIITYYRFL